MDSIFGQIDFKKLNRFYAIVQVDFYKLSIECIRHLTLTRYLKWFVVITNSSFLCRIINNLIFLILQVHTYMGLTKCNLVTLYNRYANIAIMLCSIVNAWQLFAEWKWKDKHTWLHIFIYIFNARHFKPAASIYTTSILLLKK